ncbi:MAG: outer membrane protein transport protein [Candidatus Falkowbacteria bacterium]
MRKAICLLIAVFALFSVYESSAGLLNAPAHRPDVWGLGMSGAVTASSGGPASLSGNPAGLFWINGNWELEIGSTFLLTDFNYSQDTLLGGQNWGAKNEFFPFPEFFLAKRVTDDLVIGMGAWVPYGLACDYSDYMPVFQSSVMIGNFGVGISYLITDDLLSGQLIFGASLKAIYGNVEFKLPLMQGGNYLGSPRSAADGLGIGASVGLLYESYPWSLGASYDIPVDISISGHTDFPAITALDRQSFDSEISYPGRLGVGVAYNITSRWMVALDYFWTDYSEMDALNVSYGNLPPTSVPLGWGDVHSVHLGNEYVANNWLTLRCGAGWMSDGSSDDYLVPSIPDVPGWNITIGASIELSESTTLNLASLYAWGDRDISFAPGRAASGHHTADIWGGGFSIIHRF